MIVDAHAHLLPSEEGMSIMRRYIEEAHLDAVVAVAGGMINPRALANFLRGTEALLRDEPANDFVLAEHRRLPAKVYPFVQVNPAVHDVSDVEQMVTAGAVGLKLNPLVDRIAFGSDDLTDILAFGDSRRMVLYTHILLNKPASLAALEERVRQFPRLSFIIGHMGYGTSDPEATRMAVQYRNVYLETSVGAYMAIEDAVKRAGPHKVIFGSEAPAHHPASEWRKIELLRLPQAEQELISSQNILSLLERSTTA